MIAGIYNILIEQGTTFYRLIDVMEPDVLDPTIFEPFNLTGYTARMQIRRDIDSETPMLSLTSPTVNGNGITVQDGANNALSINITNTVTSSLTSSGIYDLEIIKTSTGFVSRLLQGTITLSREVTR
jgi:hypothetical protein